MPVITVEEALAGTDVTINDNGRAAAASSKPVVLSTEDIAILTGYAVTMTATVTRPADASAYAANDAFSNSTSAPTAGGGTLTAAGRISGGAGVISDIIVLYSTASAVDGEIWIYDSAPTAINDNAAWSVSDADQAKLVAIVPFTTVVDGTLNAVQHLKNLDIQYTCVGSADLRYLVKILTAYTPASGDVLTLRVKARGLN